MEPAEGSWNERALQHYQKKLTNQKNGIEQLSFCTFYITNVACEERWLVKP